MTQALYAGTFDPMTLGHRDVVCRALTLFDHVTVGVAVETGKRPIFTLEERLALARETLAGLERVSVVSFEGLLANFAGKIHAGTLIRGIRSEADLAVELSMADVNRLLGRELETVFLAARPEYRALSSSLVREVARLGGDVSAFVMPAVARALVAHFQGEEHGASH